MSKSIIKVAVLTYNSESTVKECLDSLVSQTLQDFEVLIIDDHSTDDTLRIVDGYKKSKALNITILKNGAHNIPRGRNIALRSVRSGIVAFLDSDDTAQTDWVKTVANAFQTNPKLAMISGEQVTAYRTAFAEAVAKNDETMRKLFGSDKSFCTCNCAINRNVLSDYYFNENFINGEDLEFLARVEAKHEWDYLSELKVNHTTRDDILKYWNQMYTYGIWKLNYAYKTAEYSYVDFVPLLCCIFWVALAIFVSPYACVGLLALPFLQTLASIWKTKPSAALWLNMFLGWCVKNTAWSIGLVVAAFKLLTMPRFRKILRLELFIE
jgi:glycosyltransferase involved in cell wall biosynthesis